MSTSRRPRGLVGLVACGALAVGAWSGSAPRASPRPAVSHWVAAWTASPVASAGPGLVDSTERMVVRLTLGGSATRVRLSNALATRPVTVDDVFVGESAGNASVVAGTNRHVTFDGKSSIRIPARAEVWSDPVPLALAARESAVISLFAEHAPELTRLDNSTEVPAFHAAGGDHAGDRTAAAFSPGSSWLVADGIAVAAPATAGLVVALGDSITAGFQLHPTPNLSWPALLADRLLSEDPACAMSVVNEGISGNQLTQPSAPDGSGGQSALQRAGRDVFSQPGVRVVIVLIGINDIRAGRVGAARIIAGYRQLIAAAHAHRLRIVAGTLTPAGDRAQPSPYGAPSGVTTEVRRRIAVNDWIRTAHAFDGVIDFAGALANPQDVNQLAPVYDSGDHLHPDSAGYRRMADTVDLALLRSCPNRPVPATRGARAKTDVGSAADPK